MNYYERHIGDYLKDTAHLGLMEHGIYGRLLDVYCTRECGLALADAARLVGVRSKDCDMPDKHDTKGSGSITHQVENLLMVWRKQRNYVANPGDPAQFFVNYPHCPSL